MKKKALMLMSLMLGLLLTSSAPVVANEPAAKPAQTEPENQITLDITVNPETGELSIGGYSADQLSLLGITGLGDAEMNLVKRFDNFHFQLNGDEVVLDVDGTPLGKVEWNSDSRNAMLDFAAEYGIQLNTDAQARIEGWLDTTSIDITARVSESASKPFTVNMTRLIMVDVGKDGQLTVEKLPLAVWLDTSVLGLAEIGEIERSLICWDKGTLSTQVNGAQLPKITVNPAGVEVLNQALNLGIKNTRPLFLSNVGVDLVLPGGQHQADASCSK